MLLAVDRSLAIVGTLTCHLHRCRAMLHHPPHLPFSSPSLPTRASSFNCDAEALSQFIDRRPDPPPVPSATCTAKLQKSAPFSLSLSPLLPFTAFAKAAASLVTQRGVSIVHSIGANQHVVFKQRMIVWIAMHRHL
jgi:hypothetical protein